MRSLRTLSCGRNGHSNAGTLATAEAGGAAGAGGCGESPRGRGVRNGKAASLGGPSVGFASPGGRVWEEACGELHAPTCGAEPGVGGARVAGSLAAPAQTCGSLMPPDP